jgi:hypothetical protein
MDQSDGAGSKKPSRSNGLNKTSWKFKNLESRRPGDLPRAIVIDAKKNAEANVRNRENLQ